MSTASITLSFAEVAFLLGRQGDGAGNRVCQLLGAPGVPAEDPVAQAGLSSLALRGLVRPQDDELVPAPEVIAVVAGLLTAKETASIAVGSAIGTTAVQLFLGEHQSLAVRPLPLGCYRFDGLSDDCTAAKVLAAIALEGSEQRVVVATVNEQHSIEIVVGDGSVVARLDGEPIDVGGDLASSLETVSAGWAAEA